MVIQQLILDFIDVRVQLPSNFEYVMFTTLHTGKILYGVWQENHRRFYVPGGHYELADVQSWARIPATVEQANELSLTH